jgi:hypothetical protein
MHRNLVQPRAAVKGKDQVEPRSALDLLLARRAGDGDSEIISVFLEGVITPARRSRP